MKNIFYFFIINLIFLVVDYTTSDKQLFPNLPMGNFRVIFKTYLKCNNILEKPNIVFNLRINKTSPFTTETYGNITFNTQFDDTFTFNVNMAIKDLIGGWKDNAHILKMPGGCKSMKALANKIWIPFTSSFGMNSNCPIPPGTYVSKGGYDTSNVTSESTGLNSFFYGSYKCRIYFTDKYNNVHGCMIIVFEVKRPWEME